MSWVRASTVLSMCHAQSMGAGRCSRKAGGRYMDHSVVCDADLPLNMSPTVCSCPASWTTGRLFFHQPSHGHVAQQGEFRGDLLSHWLPGLGAFVLFMEGLQPSYQKNMWNPTSCSLTVYPTLSSFSPPHHGHPAPAPLRPHIPFIRTACLKIYLELFQSLLRPGLSCVIFS